MIDGERERDRPTASPTGESAGAEDVDLSKQNARVPLFLPTPALDDKSRLKKKSGLGPGREGDGLQ